MDIARAFKATFEDPGWAGKLLLAFLFEVLIVTGPAVLGYFVQYIRNVAEGRDVPLPEWGEFGTYWVRGLLIILVAMVYVFVGLLLFIVGVIPAVILLQATIVEYAMTWEPRSLFALKTAWRHVWSHSQFWTAWIVALGLGIVVSAVTSPFSGSGSTAVATFGGLLGALLSLYVGIVSQHLYGQYARHAFGFVAPPPSAQATPGGYVPPPPSSSGGFPSPTH